MLLKEVLGYHGGDSLSTDTVLRPPIFVSRTKTGARWYATDRAPGDNPTILIGDVQAKSPLDLTGDSEVSMLDIARSARIEFSERPYFHCPAIDRHDGDPGNVNDLVYVPEFVKALRAAGYDSVKTFDVLMNSEIEVWILLDSDQFKAKRVEALKR